MTEDYCLDDLESLGGDWDLSSQERAKLIEAMSQQMECRVRLAIEETDWDECEVLDVVTGTVNHFGDTEEPNYGQWVQVYRYESHVPEVKRYYDVRSTTTDVYRVTEDRCRLAGIDPETGVDVDDE